MVPGTRWFRCVWVTTVIIIIIAEDEIFLMLHYDWFLYKSGSTFGLAQNVCDMFSMTATGVFEDSSLLNTSLLSSNLPRNRYCTDTVPIKASHHLGHLYNSSFSASPHFSGHPWDDEGAGPNRSRAMGIRPDNQTSRQSRWGISWPLASAKV